MRYLVRQFLITTILVVIGFSTVHGLSLEPLSHVFGTSAAARVHTYRVRNTQDREIAVRIQVTTRDHDADGREVREDAADQWLVFPSRMTLAPGQTQAVRVQYTVAGGLEREKAFRIIAEQVPVNISEGDRRSGINVLFRYEGSMYVRPGQFAPDILLVEAERRFADGNFVGILVRFENRGTTHAILNNLVLHFTLTGAGGRTAETLDVGEDDLAVLGGRNLLAGRVLEEVVPLPAVWSQGDFDVRYTVDPLD
jgi:fimbrial chaperone protein